MTRDEAALLNVIRAVDKSFVENGEAPFAGLVSWGIYIVAAGGLGFITLGSAFALIASLAATAGAAESLNLLALSTAVSALGISAVALIITADLDKRLRRLNEQFHYKRLQSSTAPLSLHALIWMRTALPKGVTLESIYNVDKQLFSEEELARRLVDQT